MRGGIRGAQRAGRSQKERKMRARDRVAERLAAVDPFHDGLQTAMGRRDAQAGSGRM
jgi:hypothetical protein